MALFPGKISIALLYLILFSLFQLGAEAAEAAEAAGVAAGASTVEAAAAPADAPAPLYQEHHPIPVRSVELDLSGIDSAASEIEEGPGKGNRDPFRIALWQMELHEELFFTFDAFRNEVRSAVELAASLEADMLVVPEYANVMLALIPLGDILKRIDTIPEGLALLRKERGKRVELHHLFQESAKLVRAMMDQLWGHFAERYDMAILAGTFFASTKEGLVNRALVYDDDGDLLYAQDKIKLTPFEVEEIGLSPGDPGEAELFSIDGFTIGLSICRDTFFDDYASLMEQADIWIDLKANGEAYSRATEELFASALPERQSAFGFPLGLTACLNGEFLDLYWEGPSSVTTLAGPVGEEHSGETTVQVALKSRSHKREEMLLIDVTH